jgi:hypothetical protein
MAYECPLCLLPERRRLELDRLLAKREVPLTVLCKKFGVSRYHIDRHRKLHLHRQLIKAVKQAQENGSRDLANDLFELLDKARSILDEAEDQGKLTLALRAISESRSTIETFARVASLVKAEQEKELKSFTREEIERIKQLPSEDMEKFAQIMDFIEGRPQGSCPLLNIGESIEEGHEEEPKTNRKIRTRIDK